MHGVSCGGAGAAGSARPAAARSELRYDCKMAGHDRAVSAHVPADDAYDPEDAREYAEPDAHRRNGCGGCQLHPEPQESALTAASGMASKRRRAPLTGARLIPCSLLANLGSAACRE